MHMTASSLQQGLHVKLKTKKNSKEGKVPYNWMFSLDFYVLKITSAQIPFSWMGLNDPINEDSGCF